MTTAVIVESPGFLTTVQDLGRPGHAAQGISASGAADAVALRIGNRLVGNVDGAAALEMTIVGGSFRFEADAVIALTGADCGAHIHGRTAPPWTPLTVRRGETLDGTALRGGARSYLCVRGGFDVPRLFGSASTHLLTHLGGVDGRALIAGDRVPLGAPGRLAPHGGAVNPTAIPGYRQGQPLRTTDGPQSEWFDRAATDAFFATEWTVAEASDRMGIRLDGPPVSPSRPGELLSEGVCLGAIQLPAGGGPIVLFVEHQTTGGYPKIANVISADLARLGGLRPRDRVRFERVPMEEARRLLRVQEDAIDALFR